MPHRTSRRTFLKYSAVAGAALPFAGCATAPKAPRFTLGRMRHAGIGVGGMGGADLRQIASHPNVDIVALCDVDAQRLQAAAERHPEARLYRDWRELLEREEGRIDSVHVSTPDHMHAPITVSALRRDLHVYCQKPLTHSVIEARRVAQAAYGSSGVTQMGIQNRAGVAYRSAFELLRSGVLGRVTEVHVWTDRPAGWWPQDVERAEGADEVPEHLEWDLWLGVAPERPYKSGYHPFAWRGRIDFGTGAQGDMACHLMDPALWFLELGQPTSVRSEGPVPNAESYPAWSEVTYEFPATRYTVPEGIRLTWYDGGQEGAPLAARPLRSGGGVGQRLPVRRRGGSPSGQPLQRAAPAARGGPPSDAEVPVGARPPLAPMGRRLRRAGRGQRPLRLLRPADRGGPPGQRRPALPGRKAALERPPAELPRPPPGHPPPGPLLPRRLGHARPGLGLRGVFFALGERNPAGPCPIYTGLEGR